MSDTEYSEPKTISDLSYDSDRNDEFEYDFDNLCHIFAMDNVMLLKEALKKMTPTEIYLSIEKYCFFDEEEGCHSQEGNYYPFSTIRCFKFLIKKGLDINQQDSKGRTPLYYACKYNNKAIIYLLRKGADPNICNNKGRNPIRVYIEADPDPKTILKILNEALKYGF